MAAVIRKERTTREKRGVGDAGVGWGGSLGPAWETQGRGLGRSCV